MKIVLIILAVVFALLSAFCFLPLTVDLAYSDSFVLKIKFSGITIFDNTKKVSLKRKKKSKKSKNNKEPKQKPKESFFKKTYKQKGMLGTVNYFSEIAVMVFGKLIWVIKHFKFRKFNLNLIVATDNAANTAIEYGVACSAVYPLIAFLKTNADFKFKQINISTDFDKTQPEFSIAFSVVTRLWFWIIAAISVLFKFLKLQHKESEKYERKQH